MAIPAVQEPPTPVRGVRFWTPKGWQSSITTVHATGPNVGISNQPTPPIPHVLIGTDANQQSFSIPGVAMGNGTSGSCTIAFPNIPAITPSPRDKIMFIVAMLHLGTVPDNLVRHDDVVTPQAYVSAGPTFVGNPAPTNLQPLSPGLYLQPGLTYSAFQATFSGRWVAVTGNSSTGNGTVHLIAHLVNQTG